MAKLRVFQSIENDIYVVRFENDPLALSEEDKQLMQKFGEPEINLGGTFLAATANEYTLPDEYVKVRSDFPIRKEFDSKGAPFDTNTVIKVTAFREDTTDKFTDAITALRAQADTFTSEFITDI